jgi:tRNA modification GTPase
MTSHLTDTIAALATPAGESGIAVIRMSGPAAFDILSNIFRATGAPGDWEHRRTYHGHIARDDEVLDESVCAIARGPDSYTGEDTVELSCHGNTLVVRRVLELLYGCGAKPAPPGEFTRRAFLNGKMDLIQAEAVADLIHARSDLQRSVAQAQLAGRLSSRIDRLADEMLSMLGEIEANIDFIEEDIDTLDRPGCIGTLARHGRALTELLDTASFAKPFHEGYRVAIAGPVNAGKSSLFNRLVGDDRAIVTDIPGTTRDVLREPMIIDGLLFMLQDTAGLRGTGDAVESIGVGRAVSTLEASDVVLFVVDGSVNNPVEWPPLPDERAIVILNKCDLPAAFTGDTPGGARVVRASALTGEGCDTIRQSLVECVGHDRLNWVARERVVLNARLIQVLGDARTKIEALARSFEEKAPLEILAVDARDTLQLYEAATGKRYTEDLLDTIFSRFCIGK